eukprot:CAMPEP_0174293358 /NCGR_PEP_ID=MMETSP0809-20121228/38289_1 /TAXON_ID=73025 ORGANISM="Eutreptiella gymnastica-like, Strain CCMP1594" /NCGR_SAMPLE_ID=MMETSP0809 /ASSEMBLY_ACC=CAM_ASM_000658 /LENGTH=54 /DNA_ID=CAMNT_0015394059 /DNA_START=129 /DNA_END=290 /DNA_ORIENTATION=-
MRPSVKPPIAPNHPVPEACLWHISCSESSDSAGGRPAGSAGGPPGGPQVLLGPL